MKINPDSKLLNIETTQKQDPANKPAELKPSGAENSSAVVSFSSRAEELAQIHTKLEESPEVRMDKVEEVRAQVEAGTYNPDPEEVAEKVLTDSIFMSLYQ